jgi:RNA polymerase subunit RPABC4/transcription elongation factor Spt4
LSEINEKLAAVKEEMESLVEQRPQIILEIGEKALAELKGAPELAELVAKIDEIEEKTKDLIEQEQALLVEKEQFEREEKEKLVKRTCKNCKTVNPEDARFCEECGTEVGILPREYCKTCGTLNPSGLKFCGECGVRLDDIK